MSASLLWSPVSDGKTLPDALRFALEKRHPQWSGELEYGARDLPYLQGLRDAGVDGAQDLIDIIEKHDQVRLWRQY